MQRRQDLRVVLRRLDLAEDVADLAIGIDQKRRALAAHIGAALQRRDHLVIARDLR